MQLGEVFRNPSFLVLFVQRISYAQILSITPALFAGLFGARREGLYSVGLSFAARVAVGTQLTPVIISNLA